jgi:hypothetical protein
MANTTSITNTTSNLTDLNIIGDIVEPEKTLDLIKKSNTKDAKNSSEDNTACTDTSSNPRMAKMGAWVKFERIRRITGYLVGTTDRFCNAKQAEERERVKHGSKGVILPEGYKAAAE